MVPAATYCPGMEENQPLSWTKVNWLRREYVLNRGSEQLARLVFGGWGSCRATVDMPGGSWTISRTGLFKPRVSVHRPGFDLTAKAHWSGNYDLETPLDGAFRWRCLSMWKMRYGWSAFDGTPLIRYRPAGAFAYRTHVVDFLDQQPLTETRLVLTVLGGYLLALTYEDLAAASVVAAG